MNIAGKGEGGGEECKMWQYKSNKRMFNISMMNKYAKVLTNEY